MRVINLVNQSAGNINYKLIKFPDGQHQITIDLNGIPDDRTHPVYIKARINNFIDLEVVNCTIASLKAARCKVIRLEVPYLLGSRSDIKFEEGSNNYLKDVLAPIINSWDLDEVITMDAHSIAQENLINNYKGVSNISFVRWALNHLNSECYTPLAPDGGSLKKIFKTTEGIQYKGDIIICSKERDLTTGKLTRTVVPKLTAAEIASDITIIDDICDGGRTFTNIIAGIKEQEQIHLNNPHPLIKGRRVLIITHAIFSAGLDELLKYFDVIYCTNSYKDVDHPQVIQLNVF